MREMMCFSAAQSIGDSVADGLIADHHNDHCGINIEPTAYWSSVRPLPASLYAMLKYYLNLIN